MLDKDKHLMDIAESVAMLSRCKRKQVGCVAVRDKRIIASAYNGTAPGQLNNCEDAEGNTLPTVSHSEANMVAFCAKNGISLNDCDLYVTMSPCPTCANLIVHSGIKAVYYNEVYRDDTGIKLLKDLGVKVYDNMGKG